MIDMHISNGRGRQEIHIIIYPVMPNPLPFSLPSLPLLYLVVTFPSSLHFPPLLSFLNSTHD